jgi:hypothetical protein
VERLAAAVPAAERDRFGYDPRALDWYEYWIDIHIPGLRRWSFPLLEGRAVEAVTEAADPAVLSTAASGPPAGPRAAGDR